MIPNYPPSYRYAMRGQLGSLAESPGSAAGAFIPSTPHTNLIGGNANVLPQADTVARVGVPQGGKDIILPNVTIPNQSDNKMMWYWIGGIGAALLIYYAIK